MVSSALSLIGSVTTSTGAPSTSSTGAAGPWRPPQWANTSQPQPLTVAANNPQTGQPTMYVVDAVLKIEHSQRAVITKNPVQTGAAITDNAYLEPPVVVAEIVMSNAMQSFTVGQWAGGPSKGVVAFQTFENIQAQLTPVTIATRLRSYSNMMITDIRCEDEARTLYGLRMWVTFSQIFTATVTVTAASGASSSNATSALPQSTNSTSTGNVQTQQVPSAIQNQNNIDDFGSETEGS